MTPRIISLMQFHLCCISLEVIVSLLECLDVNLAYIFIQCIHLVIYILLILQCVCIVG